MSFDRESQGDKERCQNWQTFISSLLYFFRFTAFIHSIVLTVSDKINIYCNLTINQSLCSNDLCTLQSHAANVPKQPYTLPDEMRTLRLFASDFYRRRIVNELCRHVAHLFYEWNASMTPNEKCEQIRKIIIYLYVFVTQRSADETAHKAHMCCSMCSSLWNFLTFYVMPTC